MNVTETGIVASNKVLPKRMKHTRVHGRDHIDSAYRRRRADGQTTGGVEKEGRGGECGDESEQERSRTGGGAGRREQLAPCPSAGAGTRRQAEKPVH